jgi:hypothetical protein
MSKQKAIVIQCDVTDCTTSVMQEYFDGISFRVTSSNWPTLPGKMIVDLCPKHSADLRNLLKLPKD